ncbi:MAG: GDP-L-fucose synthase [Nitrospirae bacterium]|nr:GDP-L-fucose synthase [Nitrospirota bacterium]
MQKSCRIFVAGGETLIGGAILRRLEHEGFKKVVGTPGQAPNGRDAAGLDRFLDREKPEYVFLAAGISGGIRANQDRPADFIRDNLLVEFNVIDGAYRHGVKNLLYLASSCSYPKHCPQPMKVESILTGPLEPTNEAYAVAKIAGLAMCRAYRKQYGVRFIPAVPADAFGPGDDSDPEGSHVVPALLIKMHRAKARGEPSVEIWGTGNPRREFIFADDLADACIHVMNSYAGGDPINLGGGTELSIRELAERVRDVVGFTGQLRYDTSRPDGMPFKALDSTVLKQLGWQPRVPLRRALEETYQWFLKTGALA